MEVLNSTISSKPQFFASVSIFSPKYSITSWRKKNPHRFNSRQPLYPPFLTCLPLSTPRKLRISARFGRPTNRRNSLRKKFTEQQQQVRPNLINYDPVSGSRDPVLELDYSNLDNDSVEESKFDSNCGFNEGCVQSDSVEKPKSKPLGESVLWNKLESWADQYKNDSEFWGIGFSPIFTVFQDSEGNVERVVVNEEEILRRSGIEPTIYRQSEFEDLTDVNSKLSHAKFLAREMESGNCVLPKNSSVANFVVSGGQQGFFNAIQGLNVRPSLSLKLPKIGIMVLCGLFVFWAMKALFNGGNSKAEYTRLEKEIMRRKLKARKEKETMMKSSVEVIQDPVVPEMVSAVRPKLNKQELMNRIVKLKSSTSRLALQESSSNQAAKVKDFDSKIQEIRAMARHAREIEGRDPSPSVSDSEDDLTVNELSNQKEMVKKHGGVLSLPNDLSNDHSGETGSLNGTLTPMLANDLKCDDNGLSEEAWVEKNDARASSISSMKVSNDDERTMQAVINGEDDVNLSDTVEMRKSFDTMNSQSNKQIRSFRTKPRVICSVKEAREFLSRKCDQEEPNEEPQNRTLPDSFAISSAESEKETESNARQGLDKANEFFEPTILDGTSNSTPSLNSCNDSVMKINESVPTEQNNPKAAGEGVNGLPMARAVGHEADISSTETGPSVLREEKEMDNNASRVLYKDSKVFQPTIIGGPSDSASAASACGDSIPKVMDGDPQDVEEGYEVDDLQNPPTSLVNESNSSTKTIPSVNRENWMEKNFYKLQPVVKKIGGGFRDNYMVAREKVKQELNMNSKMIQPKSDEDDGELDWMKDNRLREIVFQVRENELAGRDPFYLMDNEDKLAFFEGLERKVEKENENLSNLHEWLHSNIENLDYGADGISLYDPPEKVIPRWKGPPVDKNPEFLNNFVEQRKTLIARNLSNSFTARNDEQKSLENSTKSPLGENILPTTAANDQNAKILNGASNSPKTVIEGSDGSVRAGKKSGKEYWQHTKKWSRGFLESYNAESDPEIKAVMKDIGKDLDRWITEKEIQEAADLMNKIPEGGKQFIEKKLSKVKREMELFGPQAVVSKYQEYAEEKQEDYLWWLDLPFLLCIELYTYENGDQKIGFYSLEMAVDLELDPKQYHVIAFEDPGDCKNLCYIIQAHMEMLGNGNAFVVAQPPKDAFREAKANGFSVTVIKKGELQLNVDQTLEEVEEQITEIGSKIYHDKIMQEQSVDISALMKGVFGASKPTKRRRLTRKLKKPT